MAVTNWTTTYIDGKQYLVIEVAQFRVPLDWDPSSNMFIAVAAPDGGLGGFPALVQGEDGVTPDIDTSIVLTALDWDDPTADSASWTILSENVYQLNLALHKGSPGDPSAFNLEDAENLTGTPAIGNMIVVDEAGTGFAYATPKVGDEYWPATIDNTPSGNAAYTLCAVAVPAQPFDWRPEVSGWCVIDPTGLGNAQIDLIARLNDATAGNIVGRGKAPTGLNAAKVATVLTSGPPAGSSTTYNQVDAGDTATIYLRGERQSGANTFTTSGTDTYFNVKVRPIP